MANHALNRVADDGPQRSAEQGKRRCPTTLQNGWMQPRHDGHRLHHHRRRQVHACDMMRQRVQRLWSSIRTVAQRSGLMADAMRPLKQGTCKSEKSERNQAQKRRTLRIQLVVQHEFTLKLGHCDSKSNSGKCDRRVDQSRRCIGGLHSAKKECVRML